MNPAEWLIRTARLTPNAPALMLGTRVLADYAGFARQAASIGAGLAARGIAPGARVALFMGNGPAYLPALYGIWFAGAVAVPVNAKLHPAELGWILDNAEAEALFVSGKLAAGLTPPPCTRLIVAAESPDFAALRAHDPLPGAALMGTDDPVWLFYTSGTTGRPKGVGITAGNIMAMVLGYFADVDTVHSGDAALYAAPMSHGAGLYNFIHVIRGARHVLPESSGFDADEILTLAPRLGDVHMFAAPTMVHRLVAEAEACGSDGAGIRSVVYGGGPIDRKSVV